MLVASTRYQGLPGSRLGLGKAAARAPPFRGFSAATCI